MNNLEEYFSEFRENIIGINQEFTSKFGAYKIIYTDWTASGRLYGPIEDLILLDKYKDRNIKIASITACSNVTGVKNPYHDQIIFWYNEQKK